MDGGFSQERTVGESETRVGNNTEQTQAENRFRAEGLAVQG